MGVDVDRVVSLVYVTGSALAGVAGVLVGLLYTQVDFAFGFFIGIKAFTAAVIGGIGYIRGAFLGGLVLGVVESLATGFISPTYKDVITFGLLAGGPAPAPDRAPRTAAANPRGGRHVAGDAAARLARALARPRGRHPPGPGLGRPGRFEDLERPRARPRPAGPGPRGAAVSPARRRRHRARRRAHREPERGRRLDRAPVPGPRGLLRDRRLRLRLPRVAPLRRAPALPRGRRRGRPRDRRGREPGRRGESPAAGRLPGDGDARLRRDRAQPRHQPRPARESHRRRQRHPEPRHARDRRVRVPRDGRVLLPDLGPGARDPGRALAPATLAGSAAPGWRFARTRWPPATWVSRCSATSCSRSPPPPSSRGWRAACSRPGRGPCSRRASPSSRPPSCTPCSWCPARRGCRASWWGRRRSRSCRSGCGTTASTGCCCSAPSSSW